MPTGYTSKYACTGENIGAVAGIGIGLLASTNSLASLATIMGFKAAATALTAVGTTTLAVAASQLVLPLAVVTAVAVGGKVFFGRSEGWLNTGSNIVIAAAAMSTIQKITGTGPAITPLPVAPDAWSYAAGALVKPLVCGVGGSLIGRAIGSGIGYVRDKIASPQLS